MAYISEHDTPIYIDAFRGSFLTRQECVELLNYNLPSVAFMEEHLKPITPEQVFVRMLNNLLHIYKSTGDFTKLRGIADQLLVVKDNPSNELYLKLQIMIIQEKYDEVLPYLPQLEKYNRSHHLEILNKVTPHLNQPLKVKIVIIFLEISYEFF